MKAHILVIDDEKDIRELVRDILADEGYEVSVAETAAEARQARRQRRPDLVLLDVWLPDTDGVTLLREWKEQGGFDSPVIMISGHGTVETAVEATRLGAYDFVEKPLSLSKLLLSVQRALEVDRLQRENIDLRRQAQTIAEPIGSSRAMEALRTQVRRIARHNAWVLISGEPGTGKELLARYLHDSSPQRDGPFIDAGVATLAGEDAAATLFGTERDDGTIHYGFLEQANGGTLFLGEVADMDPAVQAKLLGALESRSFIRVGGRSAVDFDARVVAATHRDLEEYIATGRFREDLYYQLSVVPLRVPPLREHAEDVPEVLEYYVDLFVRQEHLPRRRFSAEARRRLMAHNWPGNVRELKNLVQRLLILGNGEEIPVGEVEEALGGRPRQAAGIQVGFDAPLRAARMDFERAYFEYQLGVVGGNVAEVAQRAGIERTHLYRKLRMLGIKPRTD